MRRTAPAMSTRETKARAGPVCDVRREVFALVRVVLLTRCHCVAMAGELYEAAEVSRMSLNAPGVQV